ncbi:MAG: antibiotic biosynthesis monooxygenase [Betaproteobacteria bacterium]|nr:antibiotic biosynthesis monooxygenase [Betaproteobacteria bacterium]
MYVVTVEFTIHAEHRARFMTLMLDNARRSRTDEPGCRQFDVCIDEARADGVFLYELYDDRAAFDAHLVTPHFKAFAAATDAMIATRHIATWRRAAP